jgi:hypothetical protein
MLRHTRTLSDENLWRAADLTFYEAVFVELTIRTIFSIDTKLMRSAACTEDVAEMEFVLFRMKLMDS